MKEMAKNLVLMGITFLLLFLVIEFVFRIFHPFGSAVACSEPHSLYGWHFTPNKPYWFRLEGGRASGVINSHGWRGSEWLKEKPTDLYRVAVIGDSYIEALQVELDETAVKIAESIVNQERTRKVEFMNFGRSGATTSDELLVVREEVMAFRPDLVILAFFPNNDIHDISKNLTTDHIRPFFIYDEVKDMLTLDTTFRDLRSYKLKKLVNPFKQNSALISFAATQYNHFSALQAKKKKQTKTEVKTKELSPLNRLAGSNPDPEYVKAFDLNKRLLLEIFKTVQESNAEFMLMTLDSAGYRPSQEAELRQIDPEFNPFYFENDLQQFASKHGFYHLGLQSRFRENWLKNAKDLHFPDGHWNYKGNQYVGRVLADSVMPLIER